MTVLALSRHRGCCRHRCNRGVIRQLAATGCLGQYQPVFWRRAHRAERRESFLWRRRPASGWRLPDSGVVSIGILCFLQDVRGPGNITQIDDLHEATDRILSMRIVPVLNGHEIEFEKIPTETKPRTIPTKTNSSKPSDTETPSDLNSVSDPMMTFFSYRKDKP